MDSSCPVSLLSYDFLYLESIRYSTKLLNNIFLAMVSMLDKSVGDVVTALREKHMLENSIILFISDNGAQTNGIHANHGSNYPLKGVS